MRKLIPFLAFFIIFPCISCELPNSPEFAESYGEDWKRPVGYSCPDPSKANFVVKPGDSIQSIVRKASRGDSVFFTPGTYRGQSIKPKDSMLFYSAEATVFDSTDTVVLDGKGQQQFAFHGQAKEVEICGLTIQNYIPGVQMGAIKGGGHSKEESTFGWRIVNTEIRNNIGGGIRTGNSMLILASYIHNNSQIGIAGSGNGVRIEKSEISNHNKGGVHDFKWEAGGIKLVESTNAVVSGSYIHNNYGPGVWGDINTVNLTVEHNVINDNMAAGVFQEIGGQATIRYNTIRCNGYARLGEDGPYGAGIQISESIDVEVAYNILVDNKNGIIGIQQNRPDYGGPHFLDNLNVHHNTIVQEHEGTWAVGVFDGLFDKKVFERNITFEHNTYILRSAKNSFRWKSNSDSWTVWQQGHRHDLQGRLK